MTKIYTPYFVKAQIQHYRETMQLMQKGFCKEDILSLNSLIVTYYETFEISKTDKAEGQKRLNALGLHVTQETVKFKANMRAAHTAAQSSYKELEQVMETYYRAVHERGDHKREQWVRLNTEARDTLLIAEDIIERMPLLANLLKLTRSLGELRGLLSQTLSAYNDLEQ